MPNTGVVNVSTVIPGNKVTKKVSEPPPKKKKNTKNPVENNSRCAERAPLVSLDAQSTQLPV